MPGFTPSELLEYYVVRKKDFDFRRHASINRQYEITKFHEKSTPTDKGVVTQLKDGSWQSDDLGYIRHQNENASKRIKIVKRFLELGEPALVAFWINENGGIAYHLVPLD